MTELAVQLTVCLAQLSTGNVIPSILQKTIAMSVEMDLQMNSNGVTMLTLSMETDVILTAKQNMTKTSTKIGSVKTQKTIILSATSAVME